MKWKKHFDSFSDSSTKELNFQHALHDGNPLTVVWINPLVKIGQVSERVKDSLSLLFWGKRIGEVCVCEGAFSLGCVRWRTSLCMWQGYTCWIESVFACRAVHGKCYLRMNAPFHGGLISMQVCMMFIFHAVASRRVRGSCLCEQAYVCVRDVALCARQLFSCVWKWVSWCPALVPCCPMKERSSIVPARPWKFR